MKSQHLLLLVCMICTAAVLPPMAADNYMGGEIVLGGSGVKITHTTAAPTQPITATVPPAPATGSLSVTTTPAGATVFIDGVQQGVTPATIPALSPGSHTLLLKLAGYQDLSTPFTVTAGQMATFTTGLSPAATELPALPASKKTPGFEAIAGLTAVGVIFLIQKRTR
jgi:PEGA domain